MLLSGDDNLALAALAVGASGLVSVLANVVPRETADLVGPVLFFCSDASSFVTGQILGVDGGLTATQ